MRAGVDSLLTHVPEYNWGYIWQGMTSVFLDIFWFNILPDCIPPLISSNWVHLLILTCFDICHQSFLYDMYAFLLPKMLDIFCFQ